MANQEGGFLRKLRSIIPATREDETGKFIQAGKSATIREDMNRAATVREAERALQQDLNTLLEKHADKVIPRMKELTAQGIRQYDLKSVDSEFAGFFSDKVNGYLKQHGEHRHLIFNIDTLAPAFNRGLEGKRVSSSEGAAVVNFVGTDDLMEQLADASCYVDKTGILTWKTWRDRSDEYARNSGAKTE